MSAFSDRLQLLENRLQDLVEGTAARLFPGAPVPHNLVTRLMNTLRANITVAADGFSYAPNLFTVYASPLLAQRLIDAPELIEGLVQILRQYGLQTGLRFTSPPLIRVIPDALLSENELQVAAQNEHQELSQTTDVWLDAPDPASLQNIHAFLIVDGLRTYPLQQAVVNIGRRDDNQLIIDDARVSRLHAQLRMVGGRYVIFDLDSRGGTWVNGKRIRQCTLQPGDVISLAGVPLIYGQETGVAGETQEYVPEG